jgi:fused signal recognition particle receptor
VSAIVLVLIVVGIVLLASASAVAISSRRRRLSGRDGRVRRGAGSVAGASPRTARVVTGAEAAAPGVLAPVTEPPVGEVPVAEVMPDEVPRLRDRLGRARQLLGGYLDGIRGRSVDDTTFDDLEEALILADVGVATTSKVLDDLRTRLRSGEIENSAEALLSALRRDLQAMFAGDSPDLAFAPASVPADADGGSGAGAAPGPTVWLFVGVNGVGKTTTIGKLATRERAEGRTVVMAAGDTFRAAAGEQLETWAERSGAAIVRGAEGADPSSVIFDAVQHAAAKGADLVLADTAGRLHTKVNLMEELKKVRRIAERPPGHLEEVLLVLDATTGQNGLVQAKQFTEAVGVTGVVLTKLDGTAKGGIVLAIRHELGLPIKLVGVGESAADLVEFDPAEFVNALFG